MNAAGAERLEAQILAAFAGVLDDFEPGKLVRRALGRLEAPARVRIVAAGKAALAMTRGALEAWGDRVERALTVAPAALGAGVELPVGVEIVRASHPIPDASSERAGALALEEARAISRAPGEALLVLVSGGASSMLSAPPEDLPLEAKAEICRRLLASGAAIREVNLVRRHLSRIKGGRLAAAAGGARVISQLLSDVVGASPEDIGSGPSVVDPTPLSAAREALQRRLALSPSAPLRAAALSALSESWKGPPSPGSRAEVLAGPEAFAVALAARLSASGLRAQAEAEPELDAAATAARRVEQARALAPGEARVVACEPTIALPPSAGRGGRAGWVALAAARDLPEDALLVCVATDGVDGSSGASGAAVTRARLAGLPAREVEEALASCSDAHVHAALGTALALGPTGHNLTDVHVLVRAPH